jgi:ABC-type sugar transport system permease subunit
VSGRRSRVPGRAAQTRVAWLFMSPALLIVALVAIAPIAWTAWESFHLHDLRMPWLGRPFIGLANYREALADPRFLEAVAHTALFVVFTVSLEVVCGTALALALNRSMSGRGMLRTAAILPWAMPTVVVALLWRFAFEGPQDVASLGLMRLRIVDGPVLWFAGAATAWVPIITADVWRMTPFVALLVLAGLQQIDPALYEAARMDGAGRWRQFRAITLPLLVPALLVATLFRALDAIRVFDLVFVLTAGGPGTATEPLSLFAFSALMRHLRFGYGSSVSMMMFMAAFLGALALIRLIGAGRLERDHA